MERLEPAREAARKPPMHQQPPVAGLGALRGGFVQLPEKSKMMGGSESETASGLQMQNGT